MRAPSLAAARACPEKKPLLVRYLSCIRLDEVIVLQGPPILGFVFASGRATIHQIPGLALFMAASCCLVAHVFVLNDWSAMSIHAEDFARRDGPISSNGFDRREIRRLWMSLLVLSLVFFVPFGLRTLSIAGAIALLSAVYSAPGLHAKGIRVLNSGLHLAGGVLQFLLGYSLFRSIDLRGLEIACFFALTFVAGHLMQEVRDYDEDLANGIKTNAVSFGKGRAFAAGLAVFTLADVLLIMLASRGVVPRVLLMMAGLYPIHLYWSWRALDAGLTPVSVRRLQARYRLLYAAVGVMTAAALLLGA